MQTRIRLFVTNDRFFSTSSELIFQTNLSAPLYVWRHRLICSYHIPLSEPYTSYYLQENQRKKKSKSFTNTTSMRSVTHLFISDKLRFVKECQRTGSSRLINNRRVRLPKWNMYLTFPTGATINQNTRESDIMMTIKATCHQSYNRTHTSFDF